ncbi:hypothetical protein G4Y79_18630 [Phototrophicus methaneseepsis]|uniref:Uncharacterized protein n=1 Tax=Phototrophicus methaneseepsis TaxID=2710758 RepID=A0A7S8IDL8_9CHLR|nr:hypothetical protein [Phototrophicus methaneseepsis]QPC81687.1 hypothetical protein G4Y79_18630 [Phototrophicus methaneseepsis]
MATSKETAPTIITLTLPTPEGGGIAPERATATLRGDLAHVRQFHYAGMLDDLFTAISESSEALGLLEDNPPVIPDLPAEKAKSPAKRKTKSARKEKTVADEEPTIEIPLKKGTKAVKISHLKIVGGESDAAAYRQATMLAGRLIDGKLWDGETPIRFDDVYTVAKKMKHLTEKDLSLFTLEDFVQSGTDTSDDEPASTVEIKDEAQATQI